MKVDEIERILEMHENSTSYWVDRLISRKELRQARKDRAKQLHAAQHI